MNYYDDETTVELIEALGDIAEILGLHDVSSAQIVEAVRELKRNSGATDMALAIVQKQLDDANQAYDDLNNEAMNGNFR